MNMIRLIRILRGFILCVISRFALDSIDAATLVYQPSPYRCMDVWMQFPYGYSSTTTNHNDSNLYVGYVGDYYFYSAYRFDIEGLPTNATSVRLYLYPYPNPDRTVNIGVNTMTLATDWDESDGIHHDKWMGLPGISVAKPVMNTWQSIDISEGYQYWMKGWYPNRGILLSPKGIRNVMNRYRSSDWPDKVHRPFIVMEYPETVTPPDLKLPLPGGRSWIVTTEIGGYDAFDGSIDPGHINANYFAIDFASSSIPQYRGGDIPIYAAGSGKVVFAGYSSVNGNYVIIDHSGVGKKEAGYSTLYLHLKAPAVVSANMMVAQGQHLGYMGSTGQSTGTHLHFAVQYKGSGASSVNELSYVKLEGLPLKQYQTEAEDEPKPKHRIANSYYLSTNTR